MDNSFQSYLLYLELMIFFSGYPLLYAMASFIAGKWRLSKQPLNLDTVLVKAYALTGTLYLGLQLKKMYEAYSQQDTLTLPSLTVLFAMLSLLCWLPFFQKRKIAALLHSLFFFGWLLRNFFIQWSSASPDQDVMRNNMKVYSISLLLNACGFLVVWAFYYVPRLLSQKKLH